MLFVSIPVWLKGPNIQERGEKGVAIWKRLWCYHRYLSGLEERTLARWNIQETVLETHLISLSCGQGDPFRLLPVYWAHPSYSYIYIYIVTSKMMQNAGVTFQKWGIYMAQRTVGTPKYETCSMRTGMPMISPNLRGIPKLCHTQSTPQIHSSLFFCTCMFFNFTAQCIWPSTFTALPSLNLAVRWIPTGLTVAAATLVP